MRESLISLLATALLLAQTPTTPVSKAPSKFSVTTQLVTVNLTARDKDGNPLTGLKAADFVVSEDGKTQKLSSCDYQRLDNTVLAQIAEVPPAAASEKKAPAVSPTVAAPGAPGEIKYKDRRLLVLYFDMTAMPLQDQIRAKENALHFVRTEMTAADTVAVMSFTSRVKLLQEFTGDRDLIATAIEGLMAGEGSDLADADAAAAQGDSSDVGNSEFNIFNGDRKLVALQSAIKSLGNLPEKKGLLYFSSGFTKSGTDNEAQMRATTNAAIRYNVALFPVDARGLTTFANDVSKGPQSASAALNSASSAFGSLQKSQETLHTLAADTGGRELVDSNDLSAGIVQAQKEINDYYILTYISTNQALDGQYRRIKVELAGNSRKTAHLEYRAGYFAGKEFKQFTAADRESRLQEALMLGDPITDLPLQLELNWFRLAQDRYFVPLEAKIPGSEIDLARHGDMESARLDFIGQVTDSKGKVVKQVRDNLEVKLKGVTAAELAKKNLAYDSGFELPPGTYTVKFLARENVEGKMGTFETKLTIPDLAAEKTWLPISSVVLSGQIEAQNAAVATGMQDKKAMADHPLIQNGQKIVPSVTRAFRRDQTLYVYLEAFEGETPKPLQSSVSFYRGKNKVFETPLEAPKEPFKTTAKVQPIRVNVPLTSLEPGRYTCQVTVIDAESQKVAFWRAPLAVLQ